MAVAAAAPRRRRPVPLPWPPFASAAPPSPGELRHQPCQRACHCRPPRHVPLHLHRAKFIVVLACDLTMAPLPRCSCCFAIQCRCAFVLSPDEGDEQQPSPIELIHKLPESLARTAQVVASLRHAVLPWTHAPPDRNRKHQVHHPQDPDSERQVLLQTRRTQMHQVPEETRFFVKFDYPFHQVPLRPETSDTPSTPSSYQYRKRQVPRRPKYRENVCTSTVAVDPTSTPTTSVPLPPSSESLRTSSTPSR